MIWCHKHRFNLALQDSADDFVNKTKAILEVNLDLENLIPAEKCPKRTHFSRLK